MPCPCLCPGLVLSLSQSSWLFLHQLPPPPSLSLLPREPSAVRCCYALRLWLRLWYDRHLDSERGTSKETERQMHTGRPQRMSPARTQVPRRVRPHSRGGVRHSHREQCTHVRCMPRGSDPPDGQSVYTGCAYRARRDKCNFHQETRIPSQVLRADPTFLALAERWAFTDSDGHTQVYAGTGSPKDKPGHT